MKQRIETIRHKIYHLKDIDRNWDIFGADKHFYSNQPISEEKIRGFENKLDIALPEEFRLFLIEIGVGAGPDYGILTLEQIVNEYEEFQYCLEKSSKISNQFQFTSEDAREVILLKKNNPEEFHYKRLQSADGLLPIQTEGCTYYNYIVLNGEQQGKIWSLDTNEFDTLPCDYTENLGFLDWYEHWLDTSISSINNPIPIKKEKFNLIYWIQRQFGF